MRPAESSKRKTAVLADQHPLWLEALAAVVTRLGFDIAGSTSASADVVPLIRQHKPDLLILETCTLDDPGSMLDEIRKALTVHEALKVVVLSVSDVDADVEAAFAAGAAAYIVKTTHPDDILAAIRQAFAHSVFLPGNRPFARERVSSLPEEHSPVREAGLTRRETEILRLVAQGHSNGDLARMLWVTEQTVKFHLSNIYRKLDVANRTEASKWAYAHHLVDPTRRGDGASEASKAPA